MSLRSSISFSISETSVPSKQDHHRTAAPLLGYNRSNSEEIANVFEIQYHLEFQ